MELERFIDEKKEIIKHGEFKDSQFDRLAELGYGNGGVVLQVRHKPTSIIMARKVSYNNVLYLDEALCNYIQQSLFPLVSVLIEMAFITVLFFLFSNFPFSLSLSISLL